MRGTKHDDLDSALYGWFVQTRERKVSVSNHVLKEEVETHAATFGWIKQFILDNFINSNFNLYSIVTTTIALHSI